MSIKHDKKSLFDKLNGILECAKSRQPSFLMRSFLEAVKYIRQYLTILKEIISPTSLINLYLTYI